MTFASAFLFGRSSCGASVRAPRRRREQPTGHTAETDRSLKQCLPRAHLAFDEIVRDQLARKVVTHGATQQPAGRIRISTYCHDVASAASWRAPA
jgi:hypothetical protein